MGQIKQYIYDHGGSRIFSGGDDGGYRVLIADSYTNKAFAEALMAFVSDYYKDEDREVAIVDFTKDEG